MARLRPTHALLLLPVGFAVWLFAFPAWQRHQEEAAFAAFRNHLRHHPELAAARLDSLLPLEQQWGCDELLWRVLAATGERVPLDVHAVAFDLTVAERRFRFLRQPSELDPEEQLVAWRLALWQRVTPAEDLNLQLAGGVPARAVGVPTPVGTPFVP